MSDNNNSFSFNSTGDYGQTVCIISLVVIFIISTIYGLCLRFTLRSAKRTRRSHRTVIRHRDPTEIVRDFEHEDEIGRDEPLEFEEEVIDIEEEDLDTGFDTSHIPVRKVIKPRPLDITKLHEKI